MPLRSALAALALLAAPLASAQGLTATPNPYDAGGRLQLVIRNETASPITFDRFRAASMDDEDTYVGTLAFRYRAYLSGEVVQGSALCSVFYPPSDGGCNEFELTGRTLAPGDSVVAEDFVRYCEICRAGQGGWYSDTLRVYAGGQTEPLNIAITNVQFVGSETAPEASALRVGVSPNPARGVAVFTLVRAAAGPVRVVALDALGRELAVLHDGPAAEALRLTVDTAAWPAGVVVVRAVDGAGAASARLVVVR